MGFWLGPVIDAMLRTLSGKGANNDTKHWAHLSRSSFSSCRWVMGSVSASCLGFQCLHLATGGGKQGGVVLKMAQLSLSSWALRFSRI